jgi:hypothetical protein
VTVAYQYSTVHDHFLGDGTRVQRGRIYSQSLVLLTDYGLGHSAAVTFSVPYIQARYSGVNPHKPAILDFPNNAPLIDDGTYHGALQDLGFAVRYNFTTKPVTFTPFVGFNVPSHDYPFFGHSAVGRNQRQLLLGANVGGPIELLPRSYFHARYAYAFMQRMKVGEASYGGNLSQVRVDFGYFLTPRLSLKAIQIAQIAHGGLTQPTDYATKTTELYFHHDQIDAIGFLELGGGFDFALSHSFDVSSSLIHAVSGENGHALRIGLITGITWYFPRPEKPHEPPPTAPGHVH